ncbi:Leucine-rich repeat protein [Linderina macrospora]|uniref:Leucine-rich repeat protein n=1 Tax=Linderina macrospora TaxID=4868 RepID=A0ACC1JAQ7_9FUNG|nr:Leucine-rich repeat protein [Linderina macrospora]
MKGLVGCRRLEQLTLRDNAIAEFDLDPSQMPLLTSLDLCNNRLRVLPARISELVHLRALNVDRNDLEFVDLLGAPSNVRELRVSENPRMLRQSAGIVDARAWHKKFPRLRTLYMDTCYAKQVVNGMTASSDLTGAQVWPGLCNLSLRGYVTLPSLSIDFSCLQHLRNLYLPDTKVNLPHVMPTLPHLRQLVLSNAGLQRLPVNLGSALPLLQHLDISNNPELTDLSPIMHISTLEVLRAQSIGITHPTPPAPLYNADGLEEFPPINNTFSELQASQVPDECAILQMFSRLRRLRVIDLRFNKVTEDMYAPAEVPSPEAATPVTAASSSVFGAQMEMVGASEGFRGGLRPRSDTTASAMSAPPQVGFVEAVWQKCDNKYVDLLKRTGRGHVIQRREQYWDLAIRLFPNLQVLDGSKVPLH